MKKKILALAAAALIVISVLVIPTGATEAEHDCNAAANIKIAITRNGEATHYKSKTCKICGSVISNATEDCIFDSDGKCACDYYTDAQNYGYSSGYTDGKEMGYNQGQSAGYTSGYSQGYDEGESAGYSIGYAEALNLYTVEDAEIEHECDNSIYEYTYLIPTGQGHAYTIECKTCDTVVKTGTEDCKTLTILGQEKCICEIFIVAHNDGFGDGYEEAKEVYYEAGFQEGYEMGFDVGRGQGYSYGYNEALRRYTIAESGIEHECSNPVYEYIVLWLEEDGTHHCTIICTTCDTIVKHETEECKTIHVLGQDKCICDFFVKGYDNGYDYGYSDGYGDAVMIEDDKWYNAGYEAGYQDGEESGYTEGYNEGYNEGFQDCSEEWVNGILNNATMQITGTKKDQTSYTIPITTEDNTITYEDDKYYFTQDNILNIFNLLWSEDGTYQVETLQTIKTAYFEMLLTTHLEFEDMILVMNSTNGEYPDIKILNATSNTWINLTTTAVQKEDWDWEITYNLPETETGKIKISKIRIELTTNNNMNDVEIRLKGMIIQSKNPDYLKGRSDGYNMATVNYNNKVSEYEDQIDQLEIEIANKEIRINEAFIEGKAEGIKISNNDFNTLISAVLEAPINAYQSMFSFEVFGIDMRNVTGSLLTICMLLIILKLVIRK